ncbi:helix-turn-helix transcriptional regulator [Bradyrhizobium sp. Pa8]|uniref:helix-turn-helix transcriptional regulator n=1 Tax=Bradyrhizobium sp. Pa8 TaxID=3386552 RepID=UPI00403F8097
MDSDQDIARRLIAVREHYDLSQTAFADALNIAKNTLNAFERGKRPLTLETAKRIRDRYGISIDWILNGDIGQPGHDIVIKMGPKPRIEADRKTEKEPAGRRKAS